MSSPVTYAAHDSSENGYQYKRSVNVTSALMPAVPTRLNLFFVHISLILATLPTLVGKCKVCRGRLAFHRVAEFTSEKFP